MPAEEQLQNNYTLGSASPPRKKAGQRLTIPNRKVRTLAFMLGKIGSPSGTVTFTIRKFSDKSLLQSKDLGDAADLPATPEWKEIEFDTPIFIDDDVLILWEHPNSTFANCVSCRAQNTDVKAGEYFYQQRNSTWSDVTSYDMTYIYTYGLTLPTVTIQAMTDVLRTTATAHGNLTGKGYPNPTQHGHCWSTSPNPTISDNKTELGPKDSTGPFTSSLTGLQPRTTYYVRAYATNEAGTAYSAQLSFGTSIETLRPNAPGDKCSFVWGCTACPDHWQCVDDIIPDEDATTVYSTTTPPPLILNELYNIENPSVGYGVIHKITIWGRLKANTPPTQDSFMLGGKIGGVEFRSALSTVTTSWKYYSHVRTTNPATGLPFTWDDIKTLQIGVMLARPKPTGIGIYTYCTQIYVEVDYGPVAPTVTTDPATQIGAVSATLNGTLDDDGFEDCECGFEWGLDTGYGTFTPPQSKSKDETFSQVIHGLQPGTTYHFRAFATNSMGTSYGADRTFTTSLIISKAYALGREEL